ncbi:TetR/AcrR family transcriptional regulator [Streptomyces sp. PTM05]|uniref:TetR/AcrR family transcriptional regulator n=1 Tax=Streptantibioticus parmotrematis TaxID=2873249 RepID=A0ABS7QYY5_9ACTN|nr:TetR/AcrR family transcriptional regulator [Streptantibioticus parmotrematis]MBY8888428.1 TetR/AcrR family transcriptional regulator [Streptantibioticus parmotrematis]
MTGAESSSTPGTGPAPGARKRAARADALRNRDKLVAAARAAFTASGDTTPLEAVARDAGVGIGTLYRHFPTREALVEAVYAAELDDVTGSVPRLIAELPPVDALRAWMRRYAAFVATKRGMADVLRAGWASGRIATPDTRRRIGEAIGTLLARGAEEGTIRDDVAADDVTVMLLGIFLTAATTEAPEQTERLLDLVIDALRPPLSGPRPDPTPPAADGDGAGGSRRSRGCPPPPAAG